MFRNFNLPHGNSEVDEDGEGQQTSCLGKSDSDDGGEVQRLLDITKGFSDDEHCEAAFERSYPGPKHKKTPRSKNKKSPRRSDDDEPEILSPKTKKPRNLSIFGGPLTYTDEDADDEGMPPKTPGQGIGMRMSSLTLEQQHESFPDSQDQLTDNGEGSSRPRGGLGTGLDLLDGEDSQAPSDHSSTLDDDDYLMQPENAAISYGLRRNIDRTVAPATWVDVDRSGNYDPDAEAREKALKLNKAKAKKKNKGKQKAARKIQNFKMKLVVKLPIQAMGNVLNITNGEDHWSDGYSIMDTDEEREMQERRAFFRRRTPGVEDQAPIADPKGELDDLTGHPIARGCVECRKHDQDCSMTQNGEFPCAQCVEDGTECRPIVEFSGFGQGPCNLCEQRDIPCSFEIGGVSSICDQCLDDDNLECAPGARSGYTADRIDLNRILYGPDRKYANCTYCRTHKKRCSLKKKEDKPPCKYCKKHSIGCTFDDALPLDILKKSQGKGRKKAADATASGSSRRKAKNGPPEVSIPDSEFFDAEDLMDLQREDDQEYEREDTPEMEMEDAEGRKGFITKIQTSFAHPIKFYTTEEDALTCSFCEFPVFGFVGYFEKTIHVIKWHNGMGYTEIAAGHREEHDATTMCQECTIPRLQIMACPRHTMQQADEKDAAQDFDAAADELMHAELSAEVVRYQLQRWCSMCFSLATFRCCVPQPSITAPMDDEEAIDGCGLRLCDRCEHELRVVFEGDFRNMADAFDGRPKASAEDDGEDQVVIRADVGFLKADGLLMKTIELQTED